MNTFLKYAYYIGISLFSIVTALGPFNPFGNYDMWSESRSSSPVALVVQGAFIVLLAFTTKGCSSFYKSQFKALFIFALLFIVTSLFYAFIDIKQSFWSLILKLILCITLYLKLPEAVKKYPLMLQLAMLSFAATSILLSCLFVTGNLDHYTIWADGRAFVFGENPNSYSTRIACSALFVLYLVIENPFKLGKNRFALLLTEFPLIVSVFASGSRGSFIILFLCIAVYLWFLPIKNAVFRWCVIAIAVVGLLFIVKHISETNKDFSMFDRLTATIETGDDAGRTRLSAAAKEIFLDNFIFGRGAMGFERDMLLRFGLTHTVHNVYWYVAATTGVLGLIAFCFFLIPLGFKAWQARKREPFSLVLFIAMALIGSKTGGALTYVTMWFIFALSATLALSAKRS